MSEKRRQSSMVVKVAAGEVQLVMSVEGIEGDMILTLNDPGQVTSLIVWLAKASEIVWPGLTGELIHKAAAQSDEDDLKVRKDEANRQAQSPPAAEKEVPGDRA